MEKDSLLVRSGVPSRSLPVPANRSALDRNRAKAVEALRLAEDRTGVKCQSYLRRLDVLRSEVRAAAESGSIPDKLAGQRDLPTPLKAEPMPSSSFPVQPKLALLFPERSIASGSVIAVQRGVSLLFGFLAAASQFGTWISFVGMPGVGVLAANQAGLALDRVALVPQVGTDAGEVVGTLLDAMCVVVGPRAGLSAADRRRLAARTRERGTVLFALGEWPGAHLSFEVLGYKWGGLDRGQGWLRTCHAEVRRKGRGSAAVAQNFEVELPLLWSQRANSEPWAASSVKVD